MGLNTIKAFAYRMFLHFCRYPSWVISDLIIWPFLLIVSFGLLVVTLTADMPAETSMSFLTYVVSASIIWRCMTVFQENISMGFLEDFFHSTMRQTWILPFRIKDMILGNAIFALVGVAGTLITALLSAFLMFGVVYEPLWIFILCLGLSMVWGVILGSLVIGMLLRLGEGATRLTWVITDIVVLTSGIFYPLEILPEPLLSVARVLPSTYLFQMMKDHAVVLETLVPALVLILIYFVVIRVFVKRSLRYAKKIGRLIKFG